MKDYLLSFAILAVALLLSSSILLHGNEAGIENADNRAYWNTASPFSIVDYRVSGSNITLTMVNRLGKKVVLAGVALDGIDIKAPPTALQVGEEKKVNGIVPSICVAGNAFAYRSVELRYFDEKWEGGEWRSTKPLSGTCS